MKRNKITAKQLIRESLERAILMHNPWLAVHELDIMGVSDCAASARLREMARSHDVVSRWREGARVKEWRVLDSEEKEVFVK